MDAGEAAADRGPAGDLRQALGLTADEPVRLLASGPRLVLLERTGGGPALPGRPPGIVCDVEVVPLADLLGLLHRSGRSGLLHFSDEGHAKSVYLREGEVVFAASNQRVDRIGAHLVRSGVIRLEQLREAERHFSPPERFGRVLVQRGFLTPRELWNAVRFQVEEIVRSLFAYTAGTVCFWEGDLQPDNVVRLALPTRRLVAEGLERREELLRFLASLEDPETRVEPVSDRREHLAGAERDLFEALERTGGRFPAACAEAGLDPRVGARTLQLLRVVGAARLRRDGGGGDVLGEGDLHAADPDALRASVAAHVKLIEELAVPLVAMEGPGPVRERVARVVAELAAQHSELLAGLELGPGGTLDPDVLVQRASAIPEAPLSEVRSALGEIVSYLEFELRNHAALDDPERFLAEARALRATLPL